MPDLVDAIINWNVTEGTTRWRRVSPRTLTSSPATSNEPNSEHKEEIMPNYSHDACIVMNDELRSIIQEIWDDYRHDIAFNMLRATFSSRAKDYITYLGVANQDNEKISYLNKSKLTQILNKGADIWNSNSRIMAKPATIIEKLFPERFNDREKESFVTLYKSMAGKQKIEELKIDIVQGAKIRKYYLCDNYSKADKNCELWESCMCGEDCQDYFDIYCKNKRHVGMAVVFGSDELVMARCILWYPQGKEEGKPIYHDRIYAISQGLKRIMQRKLDLMGIINISDKNSYPPKKEYKISIALEQGTKDIELFPYMDTMYYINGNTLQNFHEDGFRELRGTDGNRLYGECHICGEELDEDEGYVSYRGSAHYNRVLCENHREWSEYLNSWLARSESVETYDGECTHRDRRVTLYNGEWADCNDTDVIYSKDGLAFVNGDDEFEKIGGDWYKIGGDLHTQIKDDELQQVLQ